MAVCPLTKCENWRLTCVACMTFKRCMIARTLSNPTVQLAHETKNTPIGPMTVYTRKTQRTKNTVIGHSCPCHRGFESQMHIKTNVFYRSRMERVAKLRNYA